VGWRYCGNGEQRQRCANQNCTLHPALLIAVFLEIPDIFSVPVQTRRKEYQSQIRSTTTAGVAERGRLFSTDKTFRAARCYI
jgi:hypothetical protein